MTIHWYSDIAASTLRHEAAELCACHAYEASAWLFVDVNRGLGVYTRRAFKMLLRRTWHRIPAGHLARKLFSNGQDLAGPWIDRVMRDALVPMKARQEKAARKIAAANALPFRASLKIKGLDVFAEVK